VYAQAHDYCSLVRKVQQGRGSRNSRADKIEAECSVLARRPGLYGRCNAVRGGKFPDDAGGIHRTKQSHPRSSSCSASSSSSSSHSAQLPPVRPDSSPFRCLASHNTYGGPPSSPPKAGYKSAIARQCQERSSIANPVFGPQHDRSHYSARRHAVFR
jgi:hypothetical protein